MPPVIDASKCSGCGFCADICNSNIFVHDPEQDKIPQVRFPDECWHCDSCVIDCPRGAISLRLPLPFMMLCTESSQLKGE